MKNHVKFLVAPLLATSMLLSAAETDLKEKKTKRTFDTAEFSSNTVTPELHFSFRKKSHDFGTSKSSSQWIGATYTHEFLKPNFLYYGADVSALWGRVQSKVKHDSFGEFKYTAKPFAGGAEARAGYTYIIPKYPKAMVTPYGGFGLTHFMPCGKDGANYANGLYFAVGADAMYQVRTSLKAGVSTKLTYTLGHRVVLEDSKAEYVSSKGVGFKLGLPLVYKHPKLQGWTFRFEPKVMNADVKHMSSQYAAGLTCNYTF